MKGTCALYDVETKLLESHIYPKFVVNYTKKTGSRFLRRFANPNVRQQDGIKLYLLSQKAEQEFSLREKWFAENIFVPYLNGRFKLEYNENLYYFAVSFLWRILVLEFKSDHNLKDKWYYDIIINAEKEWKEYLTTGKLPNTYNQFCLLFTDRVKQNYSELRGVDFYLTRILDATIVDNESQTCLLIYGKFNRFMFWVNLKNYGGEDKLVEVEIKSNGGIFQVPQNLEYFPICSFISNRIRQVGEIGVPSEEQQRKIEHEILKDPDSFWKSDAGQSLFNDTFNLDK